MHDRAGSVDAGGVVGVVIVRMAGPGTGGARSWTVLAARRARAAPGFLQRRQQRGGWLRSGHAEAPVDEAPAEEAPAEQATASAEPETTEDEQ